MKSKEIRQGLEMNLQLFGMGNPDQEKNTEVEIRSAVAEALKSDDPAKLTEGMMRMASGIQEKILKEARSMMNNEINDNAILGRRGAVQLTSEERSYYGKVLEKRSFTGLDEVMPSTIFNRVFEDLEREHPLLSKITFQNTSASQEWVTRTSECEAAWWGTLTDEIKKKLTAGFKKEKTDLCKLSAYMPVAKAMLDLGPEWLDKYVRTVLQESMAIALEIAIIAGTGKNEPIGMIKDLKGSVVDGVYSDKAKKKLTDIKPTTLGKEIMYPLTKDGKRAVTDVLIIVNPADYWEKLFGATTVLTVGGAYVYGVLPIPATIIQSVAVTKGTLVAGVAKDYFMGIGSNGAIEHSDEYKFLEDERTYMTKQYANGKPVDNEGFIVFDITDLDTDISTPVENPSALKANEKLVKELVALTKELVKVQTANAITTQEVKA